ncbi:hypothetical protein VHEMI07230 [[Torrubiella] hemipterigena]|uniref:Beta-lactamase-related domain-containing protein n=1 Tax=[Torrubiella] hemipterigena TaxID=1531966 RepID=A0A0A1TL93_9HYPO|nr:hypothetical protein VHEMI07230 [[Torrubiella] hemipterigena]
MNQEATTGADPFTEELDKHISASLDKWHVPSFALAVVDGDNVYSRAYGYATLPDVKATPETLYFAASTTKAHLGAVLSHLIHSKEYPQLKQGWETTISTIIPDDFVLADEWLTQNLTLEDAICHRTGTSAHDDAWFSERDGKHVSLRDTVRSQRHFPKGWQPRYKYQYNNMMYATLSHVVEVVTGKSLAEVFQTILWEPLGMHSTFLNLKDAEGSPNHLATGYYFDPETSQHKALPVPDFTQCSGAGAIISNTQDYAKWVKCLFSKGAPLSDEVHEDIRKPRMIATTSPSQGQDVRLYAAGWYRTTIQGHVLYRHAGGTDSTITQVLFLPDHNYGVVMFANDAEGGNGITLDVLFKLVCDKLSIPSDKRPDMDAMYEADFTR